MSRGLAVSPLTLHSLQANGAKGAKRFRNHNLSRDTFVLFALACRDLDDPSVFYVLCHAAEHIDCTSSGFHLVSPHLPFARWGGGSLDLGDPQSNDPGAFPTLGLLVAYCHRFDVQVQSSRVYFVACTIGKFCSWLRAIASKSRAYHIGCISALISFPTIEL